LRIIIKELRVWAIEARTVLLNLKPAFKNIMEKNWQKHLACAEQCVRCNESLQTKDRRFLSVFDHQPICVDCKKEEEKRPDYQDASRQLMVECMAETSRPYGDPASYCFHHFCPFKCN
jgi:hypothetical protein